MTRDCLKPSGRDDHRRLVRNPPLRPAPPPQSKANRFASLVRPQSVFHAMRDPLHDDLVFLWQDRAVSRLLDYLLRRVRQRGRPANENRTGRHSLYPARELWTAGGRVNLTGLATNRPLPGRAPEVGELVQVRSRRWLVEEVLPPGRQWHQSTAACWPRAQRASSLCLYCRIPPCLGSGPAIGR